MDLLKRYWNMKLAKPADLANPMLLISSSDTPIHSHTNSLSVVATALDSVPDCEPYALSN